MTTTEETVMTVEAEQHAVAAEAEAMVHAEAGPGQDAPLQTLEAQLAEAINVGLDAGFDEAVARSSEELGAQVLFSLPAEGLVKDAMRVTPVWLTNGAEQKIVFVVLNGNGKVARIAESDGEMADIARFVCSFVDVIGRLRHLDTTQAEAA
jgi:hypothetical protein